MSKHILAPVLHAQVATVLIACGSSDIEANTVAGNLVLANLSGHDSHGVGMLPRYVDAVLEGGLTPNTHVGVQLDMGTLLTLDGRRGYGQVIGQEAMKLGIARAKQHGSCIMTLANSHHLGRIGHWAEMAVEQGLVSLHFVNVKSRPVVAPWGGGDGRFGTNLLHWHTVEWLRAFHSGLCHQPCGAGQDACGAQRRARGGAGPAD